MRSWKYISVVNAALSKNYARIIAQNRSLMAGNSDEVDVEGVRRGRCTKRDCPCVQFFRRLNSVNCNCGHSGMQHAASILCRGTVPNGGVCDCQSLHSPPAPFTECLACGHDILLHGQGQNSTGNGIRPTNFVPAQPVVRDSAIRDMANAARQSDYNKAVMANEARSRRGGCGAGGRRPGAGRKATIIQGDVEKKITVVPCKFEEGKPTLTRIGFSRAVKVKSDFVIPLLKSICRREFGTAMKIDLSAFTKRSTEMEDKIYLRASGPEITDDAEGKDLSFVLCWYYNSEFDAIPKYAAKRKSRIPVEGDDDSDTEENLPKRQTESVSGGDLNLDVDRFGDDLDLDLNSFSDDPPPGNPQNPSAKVSPPTERDIASDLSTEFKISIELAKVVFSFCENDDVDAVALLSKLVVGNGSDREECVKKLHWFFAFGERPKVLDVDGDDDEDDKILFVRLSGVKGPDLPSLEDQLLLLWKRNADQFHKKVSVKFDQGFGGGPRNTYIQAIRELILAPMFEGADDHKMVTAAADQFMDGAYFRAGQFMGHIVRQGQHVIAGLSQVMKLALRGDIEFGKLHVAMNDLPSLEMQQLLEKVKNCEEQTVKEKKALTKLVTDAAIQSGVTWVRPTDGSRSYVKVKDAERFCVIESIAHDVGLIKRTSQIQQMSDGFEKVCLFRSFLNICQGVGGQEIASVLTRIYFPMIDEATMTKADVLKMIDVSVNEGEDETKEIMLELLSRVVESLDEDPRGPQSVSKFMQLCTGSPVASLEASSITFSVGSQCDFKTNVCSKTVFVSKDWVRNKETQDQFVIHVLGEVRTGFQHYTSP